MNISSPLNACVFVDTQNLYYSLRKCVKKIPSASLESHFDWNKILDYIVSRISEDLHRPVSCTMSYWFRPFKMVDHYNDTKMKRYHIQRKLGETYANAYMDGTLPSEERIVGTILFNYLKSEDQAIANKSLKEFSKINKGYRDLEKFNPKITMVDSGFAKYDYGYHERTEKGVDVCLASHMLLSALRPATTNPTADAHIMPSDITVLVSNDDDFFETIDLLQGMNHPVYVICITGKSNQRSRLLDSAHCIKVSQREISQFVKAGYKRPRHK